MNWRIRPLLLGEAEVPNVLDVFWSLSTDGLSWKMRRALADIGKRADIVLPTRDWGTMEGGRSGRSPRLS